MLGIMQGRLSPPIDGQLQAFPHKTWQQEFKVASKLGLACIEWVYDSTDNPILLQSGLEDLRELTESTGVKVRSICADFFVKYPVFRHTHGSAIHLVFLIEQCRKAGITKLVVPFVDNSSLSTPIYWDAAIEVIGEVMPYAEENDVELLIETSLAPHKVFEFLHRFPEGQVGVCYDTGNSASMGYRAAEEFFWYGNRIRHIHIKDRLANEKFSVPLGRGVADFKRFFPLLTSYHYDGDLILQVARNDSEHEIDWAEKNINFVYSYLGR